MRFVAITLVMVGHCHWFFPEYEFVTPILALSGFLGVEIFFVLSGFLIGGILYKLFTESDFNLSSVIFFLKRRWFRTLPNYYLILLVNILIAGIIGYQIQDTWRYFVFMQNFASPLLPFFPESWSLSIEEFAYLVLPFTLLFGFAIGKQKNKSRFFLVSVLVLIAVFIGSKWIYNGSTSATTIDEWNLGVKSVVIYRLDAIFIGVLFSWLYNNFQKFWIRIKFDLAFLGLFLLGFITFGLGKIGFSIENNPTFLNVFYLPLVSLAIAFFLPLLSEWKLEKSFFAKPVTFISIISYSLYLLHYSVVLQVMKQFADTKNLSQLNLAIFTFLYFAITIFLSALLYRFYEKPIMDKRDKFALKR